MASSRISLRITDGYRERLLRLRDRALALTAGRWQAVQVADLERSFERWLAAAAPLVATFQAQGIRLSDGYLAAFLSAELGERVTPQGLGPEPWVGTGQDGRPLAEVLAPALVTVKAALAADHPPRRAVQMGLNRALRTASSQVLWSPRAALADAMGRDDRVAGWRRVASGNACGACLASATNAVRPTDEVPRVHSHCRCTAEPVVDAMPDRFTRPTGEQTFRSLTPSEQDELFAGRGGARKAELIRSGAVPFAALISTSPMETVDDQLTETPLSALN